MKSNQPLRTNIVSLAQSSDTVGYCDGVGSNFQLGVKVTTFPDGQRDLMILGRPEYAYTRIDARLRNFTDLDLLIMAKRALDDLGARIVHLNAPYLPGARSDRRFGKGGTRYLAEVIAPIINSLGFSSVTVWDPHSDVAENVIERLRKVPFHDVFAKRLTEFNSPLLASPDAGAVKKIYDTAQASGIQEVIHCTKHRDVPTGRILGTSMPPTPHAGDLVVCDDICDGGRTFTELAKVAKESAPAARLHLLVTHGIFSSTELFPVLCAAYRSITTTNSFRDFTVSEHSIAQLNGCDLRQIDCFH